MGAKIMPLLSAADGSLINASMIDELRNCLGEEVCQEILVDAVLETTERLSTLEAALAQRDLAAIGQLAHDMVSMPGQIGMTRLSKVSQDLAECVEHGEWVDIRAVAGRLLRVGEETLAIYPVMAR